MTINCLRMFGRLIEGVGRCLESIWKMLGRFLAGVWDVFWDMFGHVIVFLLAPSGDPPF